MAPFCQFVLIVSYLTALDLNQVKATFKTPSSTQPSANTQPPVICCCSATSRVSLYDPMDCSTPGSSVLLCLLVFTQIHACEFIKYLVSKDGELKFIHCSRNCSESGKKSTESFSLEIMIQKFQNAAKSDGKTAGGRRDIFPSGQQHFP